MHVKGHADIILSKGKVVWENNKLNVRSDQLNSLKLTIRIYF